MLGGVCMPSWTYIRLCHVLAEIMAAAVMLLHVLKELPNLQ